MTDSNWHSVATSRPVCRFYNTSKGCFAGATCKFFHTEGAVAPLTRNMMPEKCRFFAAGYCHRGKSCWFKHEDPFAGPSTSSEGPSASVNKQSEEDERSCVICMEVPSVYGLLTGCSHVFCLSCLKSWRDPHIASTDIVGSGVHKQCPICRTSSKFVTPSSIFYKSGDPRKETVIERYKESMKRIKCKYFEASPPNQRYCPFGKDCFYKHVDVDGQDYVFEHDYEQHMRKIRTRRRRNFPHRSNTVYMPESDDEEDTDIGDLRGYVADLLEALLLQLNDAHEAGEASLESAESLSASINHLLDLRNGEEQEYYTTDSDEDGVDLDVYEPDPLLLIPEDNYEEEEADAEDNDTPRSPSPAAETRQATVRRSCFVGPPPRRRSGYLSEELDATPLPLTPASWEDESDDELLLRPARRTVVPNSSAYGRVTRHRRQAYSMSSAHPPLAPLQLSRLPRLSDLPDADEKERTELVMSAILASSPEVAPESLSTNTSPSVMARKLDSCQSEFEVDDEDMEELVRSVHKTLIGQSKD